MATEIGVVLVRTVAAATLVTLLVGCCLRCLHRTDLRSADVGVGCAGHGDPDPAAGCADGHPDPGPEFTDDLPALLAVAPDRLRTDCPVIASMELSSALPVLPDAGVAPWRRRRDRPVACRRPEGRSPSPPLRLVRAPSDPAAPPAIGWARPEGLPVALVGGYIVSDLRQESALEARHLQLEEHERKISAKLDEHGLRMAKLLGVPDRELDATPADRSLDDEPAR